MGSPSSALAAPVLAGACLILLGLAAPARAMPPVELLSHRASYRLSLLGSSEGAALTDVQGGLVLEWRAACDGWLSQQRLGFVARAGEGDGFTYDVRFSSWEASDNTKLQFNVRSFDGKELHEEFRGSARLDGPGGAGEVHYLIPAGRQMELPKGTIFPTQHVIELIEAARAEQHFVSREVFDGSGEDALTHATAVIGAARSGERLGGGQESRWPVSLAYYPFDSADTQPQFQIAFELSEGGVMRDVTLDYGEFRLRADLEKLEPLPKPSCD